MEFPSPNASDTTQIDPSRLAGQSPLTVDDTRLYVETDSNERGSTGAFYPVYTDDDHSERYGFLCGSCRTTAVSMDPMGRLVCTECGNERPPTQWDAAYL